MKESQTSDRLLSLKMNPVHLDFTTFLARRDVYINIWIRIFSLTRPRRIYSLLFHERQQREIIFECAFKLCCKSSWRIFYCFNMTRSPVHKDGSLKKLVAWRAFTEEGKLI